MQESQRSPSVVLSRPAWETIRAEALRAFPLEGCGFLIGPKERNRVDEALPRPNVHPGPKERRFVIDGLEYVRLEDQLEGTPKRLVGIFHSHPLHPPIPSETDRQAAWPGLLYFIQEVQRDGLGDLRAWRLSGTSETFSPTSFSIEPTAPPDSS